MSKKMIARLALVSAIVGSCALTGLTPANALTCTSSTTAPCTVSWSGSDTFNNNTDGGVMTFAAIHYNELTSIGGSGTYEGQHSTATNFWLKLDINSVWTTILAWTVAAVPTYQFFPTDYLLSTLLSSTPSTVTVTTNYTSAFALSTNDAITGIELLSSPVNTRDPNFDSFTAWCQEGETFNFATVHGGRELTTPLPAALPLFGTGLAGLGLLGWRRKRKAAIAAG